MGTKYENVSTNIYMQRNIFLVYRVYPHLRSSNCPVPSAICFPVPTYSTKFRPIKLTLNYKNSSKELGGLSNSQVVEDWINVLQSPCMCRWSLTMNPQQWRKAKREREDANMSKFHKIHDKLFSMFVKATFTNAIKIIW